MSELDMEAIDSNRSRLVDQNGNPVEQHLRRDFKNRQVSMMAIASALGTGLIIGSGTALQRGGPVGLFLGYLFTGSLLFVVLFSLGEICAFSPMDKAFSGYCTRFCDKALGFAAGWNYFFTWAITFAAELSALGLIVQYWRPDLNPGIFIAVFYVVVTFANYFNVRVYGEIEFMTAVVKLVTLLICFITAIVISAGGGPDHTTMGFRYWRSDPFVPYLVKDSTGRFLGWWACVIQSIFAYNGTECIGVIFGEAPEPKKIIPSATRQVFLRIGVVYILGVFLIGICVSPFDPDLAGGQGNAAASPFVIAFKNAGIKVLPDFVNACLLFFVGGAANSNVYLSSRSLYGLARDGMAPKWFLKLNRFGVPYRCCLVSSVFGFLAFLNCKETSAVGFGYLSSATSIFGLLTWINILVAYITFYRATIYQNVPKEDIPIRMWFQPYPAYIALFFLCVITFFNGYNAFITKFDYKQFITCYIAVWVYLAMIFGYKLYYKTKRVTPATAVLYDYVEEVVLIDEELSRTSKN